MATILTAGVQVRRHNGQCGYGPWMAIDDPDVPAWLDSLVGDEIAETGNDDGYTGQGGSWWSWRKTETL
jgi:hypothetical protein